MAQLLRVQERKARLMSLDAPTRLAADVITHDLSMEAVTNLEDCVARKQAERALMGPWTPIAASIDPVLVSRAGPGDSPQRFPHRLMAFLRRAQ
jgi:hypothetical protein